MDNRQLDNTILQHDKMNNSRIYNTMPQDDNVNETASTRDMAANPTFDLTSLPEELVQETLLQIDYDPELHLALLTTSRQMNAEVRDPLFCMGIARSQFLEVSAILGLSAPTPTQLMSCYYYNKIIEKAADIICRDQPSAQKEIVKQGLFILDAGQIIRMEHLRIRTRTNPLRHPNTRDHSVHGRDEQLVWNGNDTQRAAEVVRYTLRCLFHHFFEDICKLFMTRIRPLTLTRYEMLYSAFEVAAVFDEQYGSIARTVITLPGEAARNGVEFQTQGWHLLSAVEEAYRDLTDLHQKCLTVPQLWIIRDLLMKFSLHHLLTDRIVDDGSAFYDKSEAELLSYSMADLSAFWNSIWVRQHDSCAGLVENLLCSEEQAEIIDFRSIGKALRK